MYVVLYYFFLLKVILILKKLKTGKNNQKNISSQFWVIVQFHPSASI